MTILITGGAGFIGTSVVKHLLATSDLELLVVDNLHPQVHGANPTPPAILADQRVTFIRGDVTDASTWDRVLSGIAIDAVLHLAAETGTGQSLLEASRHANVNVNGTAALLDGLSRNRVVPGRVVLTSSRAVYGEGRWRDPLDGSFFYPGPRGAAQLARHEWDPRAPSGKSGVFTQHRARDVEPRPTNVYAATKLAQEHLLTVWASSFDVQLGILRLQNVYGAGQAVGNPYTGVLTFFANQLLAGNTVPVYEGGGITRDFVHVNDVVGAITTALVKQPEPAGQYVVDIGSGHPSTLLENAELLAEASGGRTPVVTTDFRLGDVRAAYADIGDAQALLGYEPKVPFSDGALDLLDWVRTQRNL